MTGASDGLGKALALELASLKFNIVLVARNQEKTDAVAAEIREKHSVETKVLVFDFRSLYDEAGVTQLESKIEEVADLDISILVNNVGYADVGPLHK